MHKTNRQRQSVREHLFKLAHFLFHNKKELKMKSISLALFAGAAYALGASNSNNGHIDYGFKYGYSIANSGLCWSG